MDATTRVETTFQPSFSERVHAEAFLMRHSFMAVLAALPFPAIGLWWIAATLLHPHSASTSTWLAALLALAFSPSLFLFNCYRAHRSCKAVGPFTYALDPAGIHIATTHSHSSTSWAALQRLRTSSSMLFVYVNKRCAHFIPVRALSSPHDIDAIRGLAHAAGVKHIA